MPTLRAQVSTSGGGGGVSPFLRALFFLHPPTFVTPLTHYGQDIFSIDWSALSHHEPCHCARRIKAWCFDILCTLMQIIPWRCRAVAWSRAHGGESLYLPRVTKNRGSANTHERTQRSNTSNGELTGIKLKTHCWKRGFITQIEFELSNIRYNWWLETVCTWSRKFPFWTLET